MQSNFKHAISVNKDFNKSINWLFEYTQDFTERKNWDRQTLIIEFLDGYDTLKKGAKVYTKSTEGIEMDTEYLTFNPPNEISVKMLNYSSVFKDFIGYWNYTPINSNKTKLKITYKFNLRFPFSLFKVQVFKKVKINMERKLVFLETHLREMESNY